MPLILVVDDEKLCLWSLDQTLSNEGYDVEIAESGEKAIEKLKDRKFDMVITDYKMTGITGVDLLKFLRKSAPKTAVIIISAFEDELKNIIETNKPNGFIRKPFELEDVKKLVRSFFTL